MKDVFGPAPDDATRRTVGLRVKRTSLLIRLVGKIGYEMEQKMGLDVAKYNKGCIDA